MKVVIQESIPEKSAMGWEGRKTEEKRKSSLIKGSEGKSVSHISFLLLLESTC